MSEIQALLTAKNGATTTLRQLLGDWVGHVPEERTSRDLSHHVTRQQTDLNSLTARVNNLRYFLKFRSSEHAVVKVSFRIDLLTVKVLNCEVSASCL